MSVLIDNRRVVDEALIREVVEKIVRHFDPERIILFGSHARGDARPDSDLDLIVEMESDLSPVQRAIQVVKLFGLRGWGLDLLVYTPEEAMTARRRFGTLLSLIEDEAKVLYARK